MCIAHPIRTCSEFISLQIISDAVSKSDCIASNDWLIAKDKLKRVRKKAFTSQIMALSSHLSKGEGAASKTPVRIVG
jgi:hypothetical protein